MISVLTGHGLQTGYAHSSNSIGERRPRSHVFFAALDAHVGIGSRAGPGDACQNSREREGFLATVSRWFREQTATVNSSFEDARKKVDGFSSAAGNAAKTTVEGAKDAAGAVARIPSARAVSGHEKCQLAPNGAPDCVSAANTMCKAKGFEFGQERRHDDSRRLSGQGLYVGALDRPRVHHRDLRLPRLLPIAFSPFRAGKRRLCRRRGCVSVSCMNLHAKLLEREAAGRPVTVGLIGAGKFGTMFMAQARLTRGMHLVGVADLDVARARSQLKMRAGRMKSMLPAHSRDAHKKRTTLVTDNADALIADPRIEVIVEATGVPGAGIHHALGSDR